jgi:hypothetical protein
MSLRHVLSRWFRRAHANTRPAPARPAAVRPRLEELEARDVPSVFANETYVSSLYQGFLGRQADAFGLGFWTNLLNSGQTRSQVAQNILRSDEYFGREVQILYQTLLGRQVDVQGLSVWLGQLHGGATGEQVREGILASDEYFALTGGTNAGFITGVYRTELGRDPDGAGFNHWDQALMLGASRLTVAQLITTSPEGAVVRVANLYREVLGRQVDSGGLAFWTGAQQSGTRDEAVMAGLAGSSEFFLNMSASIAVSGQIDPNLSAAVYLTNAGTFSASAAGIQQLNRTIPTVIVDPLPQPSGNPSGYLPFFTDF